jgi:hypothetical protein
VASNRPEQGNFFFANRRLIEWLVVVLVLAALVLVFLHQVRVLQRQAEFASVKATLGALRTAFVMRHLQTQAAGEMVSLATGQRNPFELLQQRPANYRGVIRMSDVARVPPGGWVYEPVCVCVGYLPSDSGEFDSPSVDPIAWYAVDTTSLPFQLRAKETYFWQGQVLD